MEILVAYRFLSKLAVGLTVEMHGEGTMMITQLPHLIDKSCRLRLGSINGLFATFLVPRSGSYDCHVTDQLVRGNGSCFLKVVR